MIYVVVKCALQFLGEYTMASAEKAFTDRVKAEAYLKTVPTVWAETINGMKFNCERSIMEVELE